MSQAKAQTGTLTAILDSWASKTPDATALIFLQDGAESRRLSFAELRAEALSAARVVSMHCGPGDRALLAYPPGLDFVIGFFGCLYARVIAVPCYPPKAKLKTQLFGSILKDSGARAILTIDLLEPRIQKHVTDTLGLPSVPVLRTNGVVRTPAKLQAEPDSETVAMLQYTSGSTGTPKGVVLQHRHLIANEQAIREAFRHGEDTVVVGWLPCFHDMGLIGNVLQPLFLGRPCILMSPQEFTIKPVNWLRAISKYKATTAGGPEWGYRHCASKITPAQVEELDLSSWKLAYVGAEPIYPATLKRFSEKFAQAGFSDRAFYPCYGLAEASLLVSGSPLENAPPSSGEARLVSCVGRARGNTRMIVVDPLTHERCADGTRGEIWVSGSSVASGYWNRPEDTLQTFGARLAGSGEGPFLRTGDLGWMSGDDLYVSGRLRDLVIVQGQNHFAEDLEATIRETDPALAEGATAAFGVEGPECEELVVMQEVSGKILARPGALENLEAAARASVTHAHGLRIARMAFVRMGSLPRTSSGKIRRGACRGL